MLNETNMRLLLETIQDPRGRGPQDATTLDARAPDFERLEHYSIGDFWGVGGKYWRGRIPKTGGLDDVQKLFVADDRINAAVDRLVSAIVGRDPEWDIAEPGAKPDAEDSPLVTALEAVLSDWHEDADLHRELKRFTRLVQVYGRASLKVYIPDAYSDLARRGATRETAMALELIHVLALSPRHAGALRDAHNRVIAHWHRYTVLEEGKNIERLEVHTPEDVATYNLAGSALQLIAPPLPNPLYDKLRRRRPRFMLLEVALEGGGAFTTSVLDKQDALNEAWTNLKRNDQLAGYRSIITLNALDPVDDDGNPIPWTFGPARVQSLKGIITKGDAEVPEGVAMPGVVVVDPVDPLKSSIPNIEKLTEAILDAFDQLWTHTSTGHNTSGESKRESRRAFDKRVIEAAGFTAAALRWALETATSLAAWLEGNPEAYKELRFNPKLFLDVERGNLELFKSLVEASDRGLVSLETLVNANPGVEDQAAELQRLARPPRLSPARADAAVTSQRLSRQAALENAGYTPEDAAKIIAAAINEGTALASGTGPSGGSGNAA